MKIKSILKVSFILFLLAGCASNPKFKEDEHTKIFKQDIDNTGMPEVIRVEDKFDTESKTIVTIMKRDGTSIGSFTVPGRFMGMDFIDLYENQKKQMAIFYDYKDNTSNVAIYGLKHNNFVKLFSFSSPCGVEADWDTIYRIKVCDAGCRKKDCSPENSTACDWNTWSWSGQKFIKEN
ncbi:MAG: hypothetical protein PHU91_01090 [Candidatus Omnitrophica bacterium]|nr:hypothetical protein [Candidatus Omnitrophota bacterium]MDD5236255.1 hypothetical protein [Candidatus Omnitrophota bacterium]MDD5611252.1 hypothetical protein [Candidatus Omnitrophota bacterium]